MIPLEMNDDMKADLRLIRMRNFLDPKRFYKAPDGLRAILHEGTVIEGRGEYRSRIEKKGRHLSIVDEALYDKKLQSYSKRKYEEIQAGRSWKTKMYRHSRSVKRTGSGKTTF